VPSPVTGTRELFTKQSPSTAVKVMFIKIIYYRASTFYTAKKSCFACASSKYAKNSCYHAMFRNAQRKQHVCNMYIFWLCLRGESNQILSLSYANVMTFCKQKVFKCVMYSLNKKLMLKCTVKYNMAKTDLFLLSDDWRTGVVGGY
jgi:hypothetical protein